MKKIIFLTNIPFMKQHLVDLYVGSIKEKYYTLIWDISGIYRCKDKVGNLYSDTTKISTISELDEELSNTCLDSNVVIITNILNDRLGTIISTIKKYHCPIVCINKESFNSWLFEKGSFSCLKYFKFKAKIQGLALFFPLTRYLLHKKQFGKYKYDYLLAARNYYSVQTKSFFRIHHIKYDETLFAQKDKKGISFSNKYILFIDSAPTTHTSFVGKTNTLNHHKYLRLINAFFDEIEEKTGFDVVITLHPKSNYNENDFKKRKAFVGNTAELISGCEYAIGHYSTSFVNVVLERKPLQVIYYNEMFKSSFRGSIVMGIEFAKLCSANIYNIENKSVPILETINDKAYTRFLNNHICNPNRIETSNGELICESLKMIFEKEFKR